MSIAKLTETEQIALEQSWHHVAAQTEAFFRSITDCLLRRPNELQTSCEVVNGTLALTVTPMPEDVGALVGQSDAMRRATIAVFSQFVKSRGLNFHYSLRDGDRISMERAQVRLRDDWPKKKLSALVQSCELLFDWPCAIQFEHEDQDPNDTKSLIYITLAPEQVLHVTEAELFDGLRRMFGAVGMANGRKIFLRSLRRRKA